MRRAHQARDRSQSSQTHRFAGHSYDNVTNPRAGCDARACGRLGVARLHCCGATERRM